MIKDVIWPPPAAAIRTTPFLFIVVEAPPAANDDDRTVMHRALAALEAAYKHHTTTSLPLAIERYGSRENAAQAGRQTWRKEVPEAIQALRNTLGLPHESP